MRARRSWIAALAGIVGFALPSVAAGAPNLLGNPGFESDTAGLQQGGAAQVSYGNWLPYAQVNNTTGYPKRVSTAHGGAFGGETLTSTVTGGGNGSELIQDLQNSAFDPTKSFSLESWVYPNAGQGLVQFIFNWDRDTGAADGFAGFTIDPETITYGFGDGGGTASAPSFKSWHDVQLVVDVPDHVVALYVDGKQVAASFWTHGVPGGSNTHDASFPYTALLLGQDSGTSTDLSDFVFDDVSVTQDTSPPTATITSPTGGIVNSSSSALVDVTDDTGVTRVELQTSQDGQTWSTFGSTDVSPPITGGSVPVPFTSAPEGGQDVRAVAHDAAGNSGASAVVTVTKDDGPTITVTCNESTCGGWSQTPVSVAITATVGSGFFKYTTDGSDPSGPGGKSYTGPFTVSAEGVTHVRVYAVDTNSVSSTADVPIQIDSTIPPPPTLQLTTPAGSHPLAFLTQDGSSALLWYNPTTNGDITLEVPVSDDSGSGVATASFPAIGAQGWGNHTGPNPRSIEYSWTANPTNPDAVDVTSTDNAGNTGLPTTLTFQPDGTAPTGAIECLPATCLNTAGPVHVSIVANDNFGSGIDQVRYTTDGSDPSTGTVGTSLDVAQAGVTVKAWAIDEVGNAEQIATASVSGSPPPNFTVDTFADSHDAKPGDGFCADSTGACSLRAAIEETNVDAGASDITVPAGRYDLQLGPLVTSDTVAIHGADARTTIVERSPSAAPQRVFQISAGTTELSNLSIGNGDADGTDQEQNAGVGGGIWIDSTGTLSLRNSTISGNFALRSGGGIDNNGTLTVENSTIEGNSTNGIGAGIDDFGAPVTITNSTITINHAATQGGGLLAANATTLVNDTIAGNTAAAAAGGGIYVYGSAQIVATNTIVANNTGNDCSAPIVSHGHNLQSDPSCNFTAGGDVGPVDPQLGPLGDNGGSTDTLLPAATSPAIDAGDDSVAPSTDQRGIARPQGPHSDIGSVEVQPATAETWTLATDLLANATSAATNPFPDSHGNPSTWSMLTAPSVTRDPTTYTLIPASSFNPNSCGAAGLASWNAPDLATTGINTGTSTIQGVDCAPFQVIPPHVAFAHPGPSNLVIYAWKSPVSGQISIDAGVNDLDCGGGNGVKFFIDLGTTNLFGSGIANCAGLGLSNPITTNVSQGDTLYFSVDPNGDYSYDLTEVDATIKLISTTPPATTGGDTTQTGPTYTVNSNADPGDGTCTVNNCTLREAIAAANASGVASTIRFAIGTGGPQTITLTGDLPRLTVPVTLDATTQPGFLGPPLIELDGSHLVGGTDNGFIVDQGVSGVTIRGFSIVNFDEFGIIVNGNDSTVAGNYIGLAPDGVTVLGNQFGSVRVNGNGSTIGGSTAADRNVLTGGSDGGGVWIGGNFGGANNTIQGNYIGTLADGATRAFPARFGLSLSGVRFSGGAGNVASGNLISGYNYGALFEGTSGNAVDGNLIGTDASGFKAVGNYVDGVFLDGASGNTVARNVISGNATGIDVNGAGAGGNLIHGNLIGTSTSGEDPLPNHGAGILVEGGAGGNTIGGVGEGPQGNTIEFNGGDGVSLTASTGNKVEENTILSNGGAGVHVSGSAQAAIHANSIDSNGGLGIQVDGTTVVPAPTVASASDAGGNLLAQGTFSGKPAAAYTIELFDSPTCDPSGSGEGRFFVGSTEVTTDGNGRASFTASLPLTDVSTGDAITATATDSFGSTSPFSRCTSLTTGAPATSASISIASSSSTTEIGAAVVAQSDVPASDLRPLAAASGGGGTSSSPLTSVPLTSVPLTSVPLTSVDLSSSPLTSVPLTSVGFTVDGLRNSVLGGLPLSQLPLNAPLTWSAVLPTPLQGVPLNTLTLADVLAANPTLTIAGTTPARSLELSDLNVQSSPLTSVPLTSVALGNVLLRSIPINGVTPDSSAEWCNLMNGVDGYHCTATTLENQTLMDASLSGAPLTSVPLTSVPLTSVDLSSSPLTSVPLTSVNLVGSPLTSVPLTSVDMTVSPLTSVPLTSVPLTSVGNIVDCTLVDCAHATLGDAAAAHAIRPGATLGDIAQFLPPSVNLGNIGRGLPATPVVTLQDILDLLMGSTASLNWEDGLPLQGLQDYASDGGKLTESATFSLGGPAGQLTNADVTFTLPTGFRYVEGSAQLSDPTLSLGTPDASGQTLTFHLGGLSFNTSYVLSIGVRAGLDLGTGTVSASITPVGLPAQSAPTPASITVTDSFTAAHSQSAATTIAPRTLYLSHLASRQEVDWFKLPIPEAGTRLRIHLSHLGADADLAVLGPPQQALRTAPLTSVPLTSVQMGDTASSLSPAGDNLTAGQLDDGAAQLVASGQLAVFGTSDNRGTSDEEVDFTSAGQSGFVYILVSKYDDTPMPDPYMLRVEELAPPPLPACPARTFANAGSGFAGIAPAIAPTTQTLVLINQKRLGDTYGATAETSVMNALNSFAGRSDVKGQILDVGANANVASAYSAWDQNACSPQLANGVVRAIGTLLDTAQQQDPGLKYLVIIGGDDQIPSARLVDSTLQANEATFWSSFPFQLNNEYIGAVARGYLLSDDPYGDPDPQQFLGGQLYVPKLALGRLVETPSDIVNQLTAFANANGALNPQGELTTGYDFLLDGATSVEQSLLHTVPTGTGSDLLNNTWSHADLVAKLWPTTGPTPTIDSINAHYDQYRSLPALGNTNHDQSDLFQSGEVAQHGGATAAAGRLVFTMGCHSGFTLFDQLFAPSALPAGVTLPSGFALDWPQAWLEAGAAGFMGNLGFGLGDDAAVAYSELLNADFAARLDGTMTVGQALEFAKQEYVGGLGVVSLYDAKASNEATYYGLPMYRVGSGTPPAPPAPPTTFTDGATGLTAATFSTTPTFTQVHTALGDYFTINGHTQVTNRRPIEPLTTIDMTVAGTTLHGALLTGLTSTDTPNFHAAFSRVVADLAANEPELTGDVNFPAKPQSISTLTTPNGDRQRVVLIAGQFRSDPGGADVGTNRLFTQIQGRAFYSTSPDFVDPTLTGMEVLQAGSNVAFSVNVRDFTDTGADGTIKEALVLYRDGSGTWKRADLSCANGRCSGAGPLTGTTVDYLAEAVDAAGNVGSTSGKAAATGVTLPPATGPSHITITAATQPQPNGFYGASPVHLTATDDTAGVTLSVSIDGAAFAAYGGGIDVSGDGVHIVEVRGSDGADALTSVAIDTLPPTITLTTPQDGAVFLAGDSFLVDYTCADAGSGVASCAATQDGVAVKPGDPLNTNAGTHTFTVTATDRMGHTATATATYQAWPWTGFLSPVNNPPTINLAKAGSAIPVKFQLGGNRGLSIFAAGYPKSQQIACDPNAVVDGIEQTVTAGGSSLSYDSTTNTYTYVWKTDGSWVGTCRQFVLKFPNGSARRADFKFK